MTEHSVCVNVIPVPKEPRPFPSAGVREQSHSVASDEVTKDQGSVPAGLLEGPGQGVVVLEGGWAAKPQKVEVRASQG